ncbi:MAG: hypothetical protein HY822_19405 [Acidobacteria bacterium]|nr:hypothetical protein [Acidobacteriota bacterium]
MPEILEKLRPDLDLQCYFERPSAVAALSGASGSGFTVSGTFRQQFDWAVIEWNRDNVFEHPLFRNLPDGDLSGLTLSYEETRRNAIPMDSDLYPTVDWPYLRIWAWNGVEEELYKVRLRDYAQPVEGSYQPAWAEFELQGTPTTGDYVSVVWPGEHHTYQLYSADTIESAAGAIQDSINAFSPAMRATRTGPRLRVECVSALGANGNRLGAYTFVAGAKTENWQPEWRKFSGGVSPAKWRVTLNFAALVDIEGRTVPAQSVRKMRWTYAADWQEGAVERSEFEVAVTDWTVTGTGRAYSVAAPASVRVEDDSPLVRYAGNWIRGTGNFSGGTIHHTQTTSSSATCSYRCPGLHRLYLGTRMAFSGGAIGIRVDDGPEIVRDLELAGEDVLIRLPLGEFTGGRHEVVVTHRGPDGASFYFDFLEAAVPTTRLPEPTPTTSFTLATDWDTDHSIAVAPERTAWMLHSLGFRGRANHYVGALWFYELVRAGHQYAMGTVDFAGSPQPNQITEIVIGRTDYPPETRNVLQHLNLIGDTAASVARVFELEINRGYTAIRAEAEGARLCIYSRSMGEEGNRITLQASPAPFSVAGGATFTGGVDGEWRTDLEASPRLNRAVRDWTRAYLAALKSYGIGATTAFSMELQHGDPSPEIGIAQRYPGGGAVLLNTPALQTNFSPASLAFWKEVYREMAGLQDLPYLQFGEVQWWYFPDATGMPFYDAYTKDSFRAAYGREMRVITGNTADPAQYAEESAFLAQLIGEFTTQVVNHVRAAYPACRFEVLYPPDVNETALNRAVNLPTANWTAATLHCLKTESFSYTYERNLNKSRASMGVSRELGFPKAQRSHLVGISDSSTAWLKEARVASGEVDVVVLFALDQFCLIGYPTPLRRGLRRAVFLG